MKKIALILFLGFNILSFGQELGKSSSVLDRKHEVKIGAIKLLAGPILEGTYEYINNSDFTFGSSLLFNLDKDNDYPEDFSITPFARFYFQESKEYGASGFFVEGFAKYSSGRDTFNSGDDDYNAAALGISLGKKWFNKTGFVFEILVGAGRTLGGSDATPDAIFRGDLNLGYRF